MNESSNENMFLSIPVKPLPGSKRITASFVTHTEKLNRVNSSVYDFLNVNYVLIIVIYAQEIVIYGF